MHFVRRFHLSQLVRAGSILIRHCGATYSVYLGLTDYNKSKSEVGHWLHFIHRFMQPNDVLIAFAFDIMSCSPTSHKCDKFSDYFCFTY